MRRGHASPPPGACVAGTVPQPPDWGFLLLIMVGPPPDVSVVAADQGEATSRRVLVPGRHLSWDVNTMG